MSRPDVIVIGAGPAGLAGAYELVRGGVRPLVLEKSASVGGISRTEQYKSCRIDIGGHRFYTRNTEIARLWQEMLGEEFLQVPRLSRIYFGGRMFNYPLSLSNTVTNLGVLESARILGSYLKARLRPHVREENFEQWVSNRFGTRLFEKFFKTYTEKVWGIPCQEIRADWTAQRIGGLSVTTAILNALLGTNDSATLIDRFHYPLRGPGMMWERFAAHVQSRGGEIRTGAEALRLTHEGGRVREVLVRAGSEMMDLPARHVISSMPLDELVGRLSPLPPPAVQEAASGLRHRAFLIVALLLDRRDLFPDNWIYVHDRNVRVGRIQNFRNWSPGMADDDGISCLGMEYFCNEGDELWTRDSASLVRLATEELATLGLARYSDVRDGCVIRQPKAYPVYDRNYRSNVETIRQYLARFSNLHTVGRNGMHRCNNQDHSMLTGTLAARCAMGRPCELWDVNVEQAYGESAPLDRTSPALCPARLRDENPVG